MNNTKAHHITWTSAGISLLALFALVLIFHQPLYNQLYSWDLIPKPETYTELYFVGTPQESYAHGQPYSLAFTLHNVEYQDIPYTYTIDQLDSTGTTIATLAQGSFTLTQDSQKTLSIPLALTDSASTSTVRVTISFLENNKNKPTTESIHYLVKEEAV